MTWGADICRILAAAIQGAEAGEAVRIHVSRETNRLHIDQLQVNLDDYKRILVMAVGKASLPMVESITDMLDDRLTAGWLITKDGYLDRAKYTHPARVKLIEAGHPIPDSRNVTAGKEKLSAARNIERDDLVFLLLSGGGSALMMHPAGEITLEDTQGLTTLLLRCGAPISEINTIRKHCDDFKGGGLARLLFPARVITLILSDVLGDSVDMIASGPTTADPTTFAAAWEILEKFQIADQVPIRVRTHLLSGLEGKIAETLKPGDLALGNVTHIVIGNNRTAINSAEEAAKYLGFSTRILTSHLQGEAAQTGRNLAEEAIAILSTPNAPPRPTCLMAGGETTVTIHGDGTGGRNQELALGAVTSLAGASQIVFVALATDGGDGPTDAAGAIVTHETYAYGQSLGLDPLAYLQRNDSYHYFERLDDLIKTGPTSTNVNDLVFFFSV